MSDSVPEVDAANATELRKWLETNHRSEKSAWLVLWKKSSGHESIPIGAAIDQALCFGWVDSKSQSIDENRYRVYFSARKPGSGWSRVNKDKIARLTDAGLLAPAGIAVVQRAQNDGSWTILDGPEAGIVPPDLETALTTANARQGFDGLTPGARKAILTWLVTAKRDATRANRIAKTVEAVRDGRSPLS